MPPSLTNGGAPPFFSFITSTPNQGFKSSDQIGYQYSVHFAANLIPVLQLRTTQFKWLIAHYSKLGKILLFYTAWQSTRCWWNPSVLISLMRNKGTCSSRLYCLETNMYPSHRGYICVYKIVWMMHLNLVHYSFINCIKEEVRNVPSRLHRPHTTYLFVIGRSLGYNPKLNNIKLKLKY